MNWSRTLCPGGTALESVDVWFQDEARIGQKGMLSRIWAPLGSRPPVVRDHRYGYCYQFSAASPTAGQAVGHSCARANTDEMNRHLLDLSAVVPQGRHGSSFSTAPDGTGQRLLRFRTT